MINVERIDHIYVKRGTRAKLTKDGKKDHRKLQAHCAWILECYINKSNGIYELLHPSKKR